MTPEQSSASSVADSSTFGHPEESEDTDTVSVLCENQINAPSTLEVVSVVVDTTMMERMEERGLYRLAFAILLLVLGLLLDARRLVESAVFMML